MDTHRSERVAEALRVELVEIVGYELEDPRIAEVSVTEVLVSPDLRHATVRLAVSGDSGRQKQVLEALEGARGYVRRQLALRLDLYRMPELHFESDMQLGLRPRAAHLLRRARKGRPRGETPSSPEKNPVE